MSKEISIKNQIDDKYRRYALYVIESRGIPNWYDSLSNVQRMILDNAPSSFNKTMTIIGSVVSSGYHHGDCLSGETMINLADGTTISIRDWAELYPDLELYVKCVDDNGKETISIGHSPRIGQETNEFYEIELDDGEIIVCTKNHPFLLESGEYVKAENLKIDDDVKTI